MKYDRINPLDSETGLTRIVVETPKGSRHKYAFDPKPKCFVLRKSLPPGMMFPFDFGFVPRTKGGDGDPLDVLILSDAPLFPGCVVQSRIVGLIEAEQREDGKVERNDRFLAIAEASSDYKEVGEPDDLPSHVLKQTEAFFVAYNQMAGKKFKPLRVLGSKGAIKFLRKNLKENQ
jgi:inorganic pyrophosphatase